MIMNYINDIPLYNKNDKEDSVNLVIEICPDTSDKKELLEPEFNQLICVRQVIGLYPFYYGSFPLTYAGDKDPLDFILFTDIKHNDLDLVKADVIGAIRTIDAGELDDKIICIECDCSIMNARKHLKKALKFLKAYKGKNADMTIDKKLASMAEANKLVEEAHKAWKEHIKPIKILKNSTQAKSGIVSNNINPGGVRVVRR